MKPLGASMSKDSEIFEEFVSFATASSQLTSPRKNKTISKLSFSQQKNNKRIRDSRNVIENCKSNESQNEDGEKQKDVKKKPSKKNRNQNADALHTEKYFCPLCQIPFNSVNILPEIHVSRCAVAWDELVECPHGKDCIETSLYHFKDYSHRLLAEARATEIVVGSDFSKSDSSDSAVKMVVSSRKRVISETSTESSLDLLSDEPDSVKQITYGKKSKEPPLVTSSQSTYFDPGAADNASVNSQFDPVNSLTGTSEMHIPICYQSNEKMPPRPKSHVQCNGPATRNIDKVSCSEESSKSVSILRISGTETSVKMPFRAKKPSNISRSLSVRKEQEASENVNNGCIGSTSSTYIHKESSTFDTTQSINEDITDLRYDADSDSSVKTDSMDVFSQKNLQFKGSIKFKRKHDEDSEKSTVDSPITSCSLPCNCLSKTDSEVPSVQMKICPPKKSIGSPVKMHLTYDKTGWQAVGIDTIPGATIDEVNVGVCKCRSAVHVNCTVASPKSAVKTPSPKKQCLEEKFALSLGELGFPLDTKHTDFTKEVSILADVGREGSYSTNIVFSQKSAEARNKEKGKTAKDDWKKIMERMRQKGYADMRVVSSESVSSSSESVVRGKDEGIAKGRVIPDNSRTTKKCPFYKKIPDTTFVVDAFQYGIIPGVTSYFLTHFHSDHYIGLRKAFNKPIYCSAVTAALVKKKIGVEDKYITVLELDEQRVIGMVRVTALDANHCPGSIMLLFQMADGRNFLHVGDFRYYEVMKSYPALQSCVINKLFLDTTYCDPKYDFPTQEEVITKAIEITKIELQKYPKTLIVCGSYLIGKEKVFKGISEAIGAKLWARTDKRGVLKCLCDPYIEKRLVVKPYDAQVHVLAMKELNCKDLKDHLNSMQGVYSRILAFRPSGWELQDSASSLNFRRTAVDNVTIYGVPYSEHSSYSELRQFVQFVRPEQIVPTVNVGRHSEMQRHFTTWMTQRESSQIQKKLSSYLCVQ